MKKFNEDIELKNFLQQVDESHTRNIIGKSLFRWHCGQRKIKIQEIQHIIGINDELRLNPLDGKLFYCTKCGDVTDNYLNM